MRPFQPNRIERHYGTKIVGLKLVWDLVTCLAHHHVRGDPKSHLAYQTISPLIGGANQSPFLSFGRTKLNLTKPCGIDDPTLWESALKIGLQINKMKTPET